MSFIQLQGLADVKEKEHAPKGSNYNLTISDVVRYTKEETDNEVFKLTVDIEGGTFRNVKHYLSLPGPQDDPSKTETKLLMIKRFLNMCGVPFSNDGFDEEAIYGATWVGGLDVEETIDERGKPTGRFRNILVVPFV